jgi:hypothetical protein
MKSWLMIFLLLFASQGKKPLSAEHHGFLADGRGQFYVLQSDGIDLIDKEGKLSRHHSEKLLGHIGSVDQTSFMRLLVFFDEVPGFQILDNTLSPHTDLVDLNLLERPFISLMCTSSNNSYWLYDAVSFELIRIDGNNRVISNSGNLMNVVKLKIEPFKISESGNRVYLADREQGLLIFDQFGVFIHRLEISDLKDFKAEEEMLYLLHEDKLSSYAGQPKDIKLIDIVIPEASSYLDVDAKYIFIGDGSSIWTFPR